MTSTTTPATSNLLVAPTKSDLGSSFLCPLVATLALQALKDHGAVSIALSGGSLPSLLASLPDAFASKEQDPPQWDKWHVFLADERCVPTDDDDSNLKALNEAFLTKVGIPKSQVYGIRQDLMDDTTATANDYQTRLVEALKKHTKGRLDIAILGFGPDGHTCSLFPDHKLVTTREDQQSSDIWVAPVEDSPKPPPRRITLTYPVLNTRTDHIIVCGAGTSKAPIVSKVFEKIQKKDSGEYEATMASPPPFPCAMVNPTVSLTWVVDKDAVVGGSEEQFKLAAEL
eukprot:scaffold25251_cov162-Cylindrotheca_fusiformis.AAC.1